MARETKLKEEQANRRPDHHRVAQEQRDAKKATEKQKKQAYEAARPKDRPRSKRTRSQERGHKADQRKRNKGNELVKQIPPRRPRRGSASRRRTK